MHQNENNHGCPRGFAGRTLMRSIPKVPLVALAMCALAPVLPAAELAPSNGSWHAQSLIDAVGYMLLFAGLGIAVAILGFKVFDKCTPGDLGREIIEHKNVAAAIVAAAIILGVCIIVAAAMIG